jgi:hypothetical protein
MKNKFSNYCFLLLAILASAITALAQDSEAEKNARKYNNYDIINNDSAGKLKETVHTFFEGKEYQFVKINGKLTDLYVDELRVPDTQFSQYAAVINRITKQIEIDNIQAGKDQAQAKLDQEQALKDQAQARTDQEQARKDQEQARIDQQQVAEDQKMMSGMIADLIVDGIVPDQKSLFSLTLSAIGMTVNDKRQPEDIYTRYKAKYSRWASNNFSYGGNQQNYNGVHMSRRSDPAPSGQVNVN